MRTTVGTKIRNIGAEDLNFEIISVFPSRGAKGKFDQLFQKLSTVEKEAMMQEFNERERRHSRK